MPKPLKFPSNLIVFLCSGLLLLLPGVVFGQITNVTDDQSTLIPGAGHNYVGLGNEVVNPANGSLSIQLDLGAPKGRGLTLPTKIAYSSGGSSHVEASGTPGDAIWGTNNNFGEGGWSFTMPMLSWSYQTRSSGAPPNQ